MSKALFITNEDLKRFSLLSGNVDDDKIIQYISIAQDVYIQQYLGSKLFNKISDGIITGHLVSPYLELLEDYIKPMTIHWALVELLPFIAYTVSNKGVFKHSSENSETVSKEEVDFLVNKHRDLAQNFTRRFIDYMCYHTNEFPEYVANVKNDIRPSHSSNSGGWVLGGHKRKLIGGQIY